MMSNGSTASAVARGANICEWRLSSLLFLNNVCFSFYLNIEPECHRKILTNCTDARAAAAAPLLKCKKQSDTNTGETWRQNRDRSRWFKARRALKVVQIRDGGKAGGRAREGDSVRLAFHKQVHVATSCRASRGLSWWQWLAVEAGRVLHGIPVASNVAHGMMGKQVSCDWILVIKRDLNLFSQK